MIPFLLFDPFSFPFQITTLSPLHTKAVILEAIHQHIYPNCGQVDGTFIQPTRLKMRLIDGVDEFEIVVVCIPFVYCGETQQIHKCFEMVIVWTRLCG